MATLSSAATFSKPFNVREYGAIGDGVADDSIAINAALTAAGNFATGNGGATVIIPPGKYKINSTLVLKDNCTLSAYGAYIFAGGVVYMLNGYTSVGSGYSGGHNNIKILGGIWDAKAQDRAALDAERYNIMTFGYSRGILIKDATFRNVAGFHAIDLNTVDGVVIDSCRFEGFRDNSTTPGARFFSEAVQIDDATGTDLPCLNVTVTNCYMGPAIDGTGHGSFGKLTGSHTSVLNQFYENIRVIGNVADSPIDVGIEGENWKNCVVSNNVIKSPVNDGIRMVVDTNSNSSGIIISGNVCQGYGRSGISFDSTGSSQTFSDCTVTGNTLVSTSATGSHINLEAFSTGVISVNSIQGASGSGPGIAATDCVNISITGNRINSVGQHGIQAIGGSDIAISSNTIKSAGLTTTATYSGIKAQSSTAGVNISGNRVRKNGSGNEVLYGVEVTGTVTGAYIRSNDVHDTKVLDQSLTPPNVPGAIAVSAEVLTAQNLAQASGYFDLTTTGPAVTVDTGTSALVILSGNFDHTNAGSWAFMSIAVSGATTIAATSPTADQRGCGKIITTTAEIAQMSNSFVITGLTPGSNTFTCKYSNFNTAGTATFSNRRITVIPLGI